MRLIKVWLSNYRRFETTGPLDLNSDLVALVGANEAGKSSLLRAIKQIGDKSSPEAKDRTRDSDAPAEIQALFVLTDDERIEIAGLAGCSSVTHAKMFLREGAEGPAWTALPYPQRDLKPRELALEEAQLLQGSPALKAEYAHDPEMPWRDELLADSLAVLAATTENLKSSQLSSLDDLARHLENLNFPPDAEEGELDEAEHNVEMAEAADQLDRTLSTLRQAIHVERSRRPNQHAAEAFPSIVPGVEIFATSDRRLASTYNLDEIRENFPRPLNNLLALADLPPEEIYSLLDAGNQPRMEHRFEQANQLLKERFTATWKQSTINPRLSPPHDRVLRVFVSTEADGYSLPEERSDGLRQFLALHAFLKARGAERPILLIDEAETHLHYDAQADLVDALMSQDLAGKVVYTTHSIGALPPDLGSAVRVVVADPRRERSRIVNSFWSVQPDDTDKVGYAPLLYSMGAKLLALTVPRYGVMVEGMADSILLPTLLREAAGQSSIPFRVLPGLSELGPAGWAALPAHAGRVICLVDDDEGGQALVANLLAAGIPPSHVLTLGAVKPGLTLEDLVAPSLLADAVNAEISTWGLGAWRAVPDSLPDLGRWDQIQAEAAAAGTNLSGLSKPRVSQRIVDGDVDKDIPPEIRRVRDDLADGLGRLHVLLEERLRRD